LTRVLIVNERRALGAVCKEEGRGKEEEWARRGKVGQKNTAVKQPIKVIKTRIPGNLQCNLFA
jgi:hypothetical protein